VISVEGLTKRYDGTLAVDGISFSVEQGEILGFLGPNGAGKTTTMKIITCYMPPTSGDVVIDGQSVLEHSLEIRRRLGYLPEHRRGDGSQPLRGQQLRRQTEDPPRATARRGWQSPR